jgi:ribulose-bisphosphate carboxylase large chain
MAGSDISIFPSFGGRFSFSHAECGGIRDRLREPLGEIPPALPAPAGGMQLENLPDLCHFYGADSVFLIGGALQAAGPDLESSTRLFRERLDRHFPKAG